nr:hypothetical protein CFP56_61151 [Quercus suber]
MAKATAFLQAKASKATMVGGREIRSESTAITCPLNHVPPHLTSPMPNPGTLHHHSLFYRNPAGVATNGLDKGLLPAAVVGPTLSRILEGVELHQYRSFP